jgi:glycosyltransferase involved in cell wall biosynthesis
MRLAAILPHTKLYGGVKRFFEMGDVIVKRGHEFYVFTPEGKAPDWYHGKVETRSTSSLYDQAFDALFITEIQYLDILKKASARRKILYFVRPSDDLRLLKKYPEVEVFANSTNSLVIAKSKYGIEAFKAFGGINTDRFYPREDVAIEKNHIFTIMVYGRLVEKKKGTMLVVKACERLYRLGYPLRMLLFDTPVNEKAKLAIERFHTHVPYDFVLNHPVERNLELYHRADIFVAAEKNAGHSNTAAEAMASGVPVIGTDSGTKDFLIHEETGWVVPRKSSRIAEAIALLIVDEELRRRLARQAREKIKMYNWDALAEKILSHISMP